MWKEIFGFTSNLTFSIEYICHNKSDNYLSLIGIHYENMPMQYTEILKVVKNENFHPNFFYIFLIFAQNIDCGYTLEPPHRGGRF